MRPKHSKWYGKAKARACAKILAPIATEGMTEDDTALLRDRSRDAIAAALPDLRARYGVADASPSSTGERSANRASSPRSEPPRRELR